MGASTLADWLAVLRLVEEVAWVAAAFPVSVAVPVFAVLTHRLAPTVDLVVAELTRANIRG